MDSNGIWLVKAEYSKIVSEINTLYRIYKGKEKAVHLSVGIDGKYYVYYFINRGFDDYIFVKKVRL